MSEPFIGNVTMFAGNFAPRQWAFCAGQLLPIAQNTALFSILGTTYGGDGRTTFGLPDFRARTPVGATGSGGMGSGPGLDNISLGQKGGEVSHTLNVTQMPQHNHTATVTVNVQGKNAGPNVTDPVGAVPAEAEAYSNDLTGLGNLGGVTASATIDNNGGSQPFNLRNPYQGMNFIIALQGLFPSRN